MYVHSFYMLLQTIIGSCNQHIYIQRERERERERERQSLRHVSHHIICTHYHLLVYPNVTYDGVLSTQNAMKGNLIKANANILENNSLDFIIKVGSKTYQKARHAAIQLSKIPATDVVGSSKYIYATNLSLPCQPNQCSITVDCIFLFGENDSFRNAIYFYCHQKKITSFLILHIYDLLCFCIRMYFGKLILNINNIICNNNTIYKVQLFY